MRNPILFLHAEDDHLVPFPVAQQVSPPVDNDQIQLNWCFPCSYKWWSHIFRYGFLFQVSWTCFAHLLQMYEVAVSAQNAERVKLEPFDGSKGYLHNGLYRDPKLPGVLKWEHISLMILKLMIPLCPNQWILSVNIVSLLQHCHSCDFFAGILCCPCRSGETTEEGGKNILNWTCWGLIRSDQHPDPNNLP